MKKNTQRSFLLAGIKFMHTAIWLFFAACIVAIPVAGVLRLFACAAVLSTLVLLECLILAINQGRCPLTDLAGHYTANRTENFDIYLPLWLARHNKAVFGTLFVAGDIYVLVRWLAS